MTATDRTYRPGSYASPHLCSSVRRRAAEVCPPRAHACMALGAQLRHVMAALYRRARPRCQPSVGSLVAPVDQDALGGASCANVPIPTAMRSSQRIGRSAVVRTIGLVTEGSHQDVQLADG
jgi:hypothetical protein